MTISVSTDYRTNKGSLENIIDGNRNTYWGAQDAQAAGKSITFSFSRPVTFFGITAVSGSANGTQILSGTSLQVSRDGVTWKNAGTFDGKMTSVISGLSENRIMGVRIYWNGSSNRKLAFFEAEMDLREEYAYRKVNGVWIPAEKVYRNTNGRWGDTTDLSDIRNRNIIDQGTL